MNREVRSWMLGAGLVFASGLAIVSCGDKKPTITGPTEPQIETFPSEGQNLVPADSSVTYNTDPPTSGSHYPTPWPGGFYDTVVPAGYLVHSLEKGAVVIYYNAPALTAAQLDILRARALAYPGSFSQVVVVPRNDPAYPLILTAWTHRLRLPSYALNRIDDFIGMFRGHGPEPQIETFPSEGQVHVPEGSPVTYNTDPPTSGSHYPSPWPGGFYDTVIPPGYLVHSLEHGAVVIYYNAPALTTAQLDTLRARAVAHPGYFSQVVVVPRNDAVYPVILTSWTHRLRLPSYALNRIDDFIGLLRGHGPENAAPVPRR